MNDTNSTTTEKTSVAPEGYLHYLLVLPFVLLTLKIR